MPCLSSLALGWLLELASDVNLAPGCWCLSPMSWDTWVAGPLSQWTTPLPPPPPGQGAERSSRGRAAESEEGLEPRRQG